MRKLSFLIFLSTSIIATDLNDVRRAIQNDSFEYQTANIDLEKAQINNQKAYSAALSGAEISPSTGTVKMSLNFSPATFFALNAANDTLLEKKQTIQNTQSLLVRNALQSYLALVNLAKQRKSFEFELNANKKYLQKAEAEHMEGLISKASLALWRTRYNQAQINLINLKEKIADAQNTLSVQTGIEAKKISTFSNRQSLTLKPITGKCAPSYIKASKSKRRSTQSAENASYLKAIIPDLTLSLSNQSLEPNKMIPTFSFSLNLAPVFEGMTASQDHKTAKLNVLKLQRENRFKIRQLQRKMALFENKIATAKSSFLSATDRYEANRSELIAGKITEAVFSDSISDVSKQRTALIDAETALLKNYIALLYEYGQINKTTINDLNTLLQNAEVLS